MDEQMVSSYLFPSGVCRGRRVYTISFSFLPFSTLFIYLVSFLRFWGCINFVRNFLMLTLRDNGNSPFLRIWGPCSSSLNLIQKDLKDAESPRRTVWREGKMHMAVCLTKELVRNSEASQAQVHSSCCQSEPWAQGWPVAVTCEDAAQGSTFR